MLGVRRGHSMTVSQASQGPSTARIFVATYAPALTLVSARYAFILQSISPTLALRTFYFLSDIDGALKELTLVAYAISIPIWFVWLLRRIAAKRGRRRAFAIVLALGAAFLVAFGILVIT